MTKRGTVIYNVGKDALRDDGESFCVSRDASLDVSILALTVAKQRFGNVLRLDGDSAFCNRMIQAAVTGRVPIRFADPQSEARRRELSDAIIQSRAREMERSRLHRGMDRGMELT